MRLSLYTFVRNGILFDFHVVEMLKHHLPLADEIVVNEGMSDDGTYEAIKDLSPKIRIFRTEWDRSDPRTWSIKFRNEARRKCTGDWCLLLDADEFMPEWEFERLRSFLEQTDRDIASVRFIHFYANYKVRHVRSTKVGWPEFGQRIHRNLPTIEAWGDGANVRKEGGPGWEPAPDVSFEVHHFGTVRDPARLRQKWRAQAKRNRHRSDKKPVWDRTPGFIFKLFPHRWEDDDFLPDLAVYPGPYLKAVRDNPDEFTRDGMKLYELIVARSKADETP